MTSSTKARLSYLAQAYYAGALFWLIIGMIEYAKGNPGNPIAVAVVGGFVGSLTLLLLWPFRVGPRGKIVLGTLVGPVILVVIAANGAKEKHDDLGGMVLVSMIFGLYIGILEAARHRRIHGGDEGFRILS